MQARKLKQILDTNYIIQLCSEDDICIGSSYIHDIIKFDRITLKTKNADVRNFEELERIYNKCKELINSGEMREIADYDGYVPEFLECTGENGYGDYVLLKIEKSGQIKNWQPEKCISFLEKVLRGEE